jgi:hypothetical protein
MGRIIRRLKRLSLRSLNRSDYSSDPRQRVENTDALAGARGVQSPQGGSVSVGYPPGYVKEDDGRPRH